MPSQLSDLNAPEGVLRFQRAYAALGRVAVLQHLLAEGPTKRVELAERVGLTTPSVRKALGELMDAGYVTFRVPVQTSATAQAEPRGTYYSADRARVMADLAATLAWLSSGPATNQA